MNELDQLISIAQQRRATDVIIANNNQAFLRIEKRMVLLEDFNLPSAETLLTQVLEFFAPQTQQRYKNELAQLIDVDCAFNSPCGSRIRANIFTSVNGLQFAFRLIPMHRMNADQIGIPAAVIDAISQQSGLFVVTGMAGSGKTTTLASLLDIINQRDNKHILTIEDPIEYVFENKKSVFSQREILTHTHSYAEALRSAVRESADIILIGEMRDYATVQAAVKLAETGCLVLSTLHTRNSISTIDRILSMAKQEEQNQMRAMISNQLIGVLSQTLLPMTTGGLIAGFEFLKVTQPVRNLIKDDKLPMIYSEIQTGAKEGMMSMEEYLLNLYKNKIITKETALANTSRPTILQQMLNSFAF